MIAQHIRTTSLLIAVAVAAPGLARAADTAQTGWRAKASAWVLAQPWAKRAIDKGVHTAVLKRAPASHPYIAYLFDPVHTQGAPGLSCDVVTGWSPRRLGAQETGLGQGTLKICNYRVTKPAGPTVGDVVRSMLGGAPAGLSVQRMD